MADAEQNAGGQMPEGLSPAEQEFFKKYGKLPPKKKGPVIKNSGKKHFDSADWSLKQQGGAGGPATGPAKAKMVPRTPGAPPAGGSTAEEPAGEQ